MSDGLSAAAYAKAQAALALSQSVESGDGWTGRTAGDVLTIPGSGPPTWEAPSGGGGGHVVEDEGTPLTQRANLNVVGAGATVTDAGGKTVLTIPGGPLVTAPGNLGAALSLALDAAREQLLVGTLNADHTLTLTNLVAGGRATLRVLQDATGNRSLTISDGTLSAPVAVTPAAGSVSIVDVLCSATGVLDVSMRGPGATGAAGATGATGATGAAGSGTFNPLTLSPAVWLKPETLAATAIGGAITTWPDSSGNARDFTQATSGLRPTLAVLNSGLYVVRFDATDDGMAGPYTPAYPFTIIVAYRGPTTGAHRAVNGGNNWLIGPNNGNHKVYDGAGFHTGRVVDASTSMVIVPTIQQSGAPASDAWFNGVAVATRGSHGGPGTINLGCTGSITNEPLNGDIAELLIFPVALSTANHQLVLNYLASRWGVTVGTL